MVDVVPTVATIANGRIPPLTSDSMQPRSASGRIAELVVARDAHDVGASDAERDRGLLDVRVRFVRDVDAQRAAGRRAGHAELADPEPERLARGGERGEAGDRGRVVDDAGPAVAEARAAGPASASSTSSSSVAAGDVRQSIALTSSVAANASAAHRHRRGAGREVREEARMVPVRRARHDHPLEVVEDALERLAAPRARRSGSAATTSPGRTCGITRYDSGCSKYAAIHAATRSKSSRIALGLVVHGWGVGGPRGEGPRMKYRTYPNTDVTVSEVGFGLWTTADRLVGREERRRGGRLLRDAADLGITLFDAADTYGNGRSEEQLAKAFAGRRERVVYATKFGYDFSDDSGERRGQIGAAAGFLARVRAPRARSVAAPPAAPTTSTSIRCTTLAWRRSATTRCGSCSRRSNARARFARYGVALGPAIGWLCEGVDAVRDRNVAEPADHLEHARAVSRRRADSRGVRCAAPTPAT